MSKKEQKGLKAALPDTETSQKPADVVPAGNLTQKKRSFGTPFKPGQSGNPSGRALPHRAATVEAIKHALGVVDPKLGKTALRSEEHTSELQSRSDLVCRLLLEKKKILET